VWKYRSVIDVAVACVDSRHTPMYFTVEIYVTFLSKAISVLDKILNIMKFLQNLKMYDKHHHIIRQFFFKG
jgi:hypothetical protein